MQFSHEPLGNAFVFLASWVFRWSEMSLFILQIISVCENMYFFLPRCTCPVCPQEPSVCAKLILYSESVGDDKVIPRKATNLPSHIEVTMIPKVQITGRGNCTVSLDAKRRQTWNDDDNQKTLAFYPCEQNLICVASWDENCFKKHERR